MLSGFDVGHCLEAGDGIEALALLEREAIDVVMTDVNMPNMDGEQLLERLAADPRFRSLPVMVISTDRSELRLHRMIALGARVYVTSRLRPKRWEPLWLD